MLLQHPHGRNLLARQWQTWKGRPFTLGFAVDSPDVLRIRLSADAPINLLLLDEHEFFSYDCGNGHSCHCVSGRIDRFESVMPIDSGYWVVIIETYEPEVSGHLHLSTRLNPILLRSGTGMANGRI